MGSAVKWDPQSNGIRNQMGSAVKWATAVSTTLRRLGLSAAICVCFGTCRIITFEKIAKIPKMLLVRFFAISYHFNKFKGLLLAAGHRNSNKMYVVQQGSQSGLG